MSSENSISLNEALNKSDYPGFIKDKVKSFVLENYKNYKDKSNLYLTKCFDNNIFVIRMDLYTKFNGIEYILTILIYIPTTFPVELRIYFEYNQDFTIEEYYIKQNIIDESTAEIYYGNILNFTPLKQPFNQLIIALIDKFNQKFPIYSGKDKIKYYGPGILELNNSSKIVIHMGDLNEVNNNDYKKKLKDKIRKNLEEKLFEIQTTHSQLDGLKIKINKEINNYISKETNDELDKINIKMIELKSKLESDIQNLLYKGNNNILEKCEEVVEIKNKEKYKYIVMRKTVDDFLKYIKKAVEKNIISFSKGVEETRRLTQELFYINYFIEK